MFSSHLVSLLYGLYALPALATVTTRADGCNLPANYSTIDTRSLPNPWRFSDGRPVTTAADFSCRQAEMSQILQRFELGDFPPPPDALTATLNGTTMKLSIQVGNHTKLVTATITPPANGEIPTGGSPAFVALGGLSIPLHPSVGKIIFANDACAEQSGQSSRGKGWFFDLHGGRSHSAGALLAWAWCAGRIIDGLEQLGASQTGIDHQKLGVSGCSRNGKGALVVGAFERRFALTVPQESGAGGTACWRILDDEASKAPRRFEPGMGGPPTAESVVADSVWFSRRWEAYARKVGVVPADHHFLAAMIAPRGLLVLENNIDWLSPVGTTGCMKAARAIYGELGVKMNMGFSLMGGHGHCQFPNATAADLESFVDRFLLGTVGRANDVEVSPVAVSSSWWSSWSAAPNITL
ncbi:hypothetical protein B0H63DRAFT_433090 [Podospora didyma]|uniref:(4-O-methyl)-D-glucuronate--lignin esterase n=1 Tax=Podospora didyma TaxID=330526 RepID=A0AAE0TZM5_9PEZI|nr:hypothetical protein B0H63DRAFT_433090 [Podospora didyma]